MKSSENPNFLLLQSQQQKFWVLARIFVANPSDMHLSIPSAQSLFLNHQQSRCCYLLQANRFNNFCGFCGEKNERERNGDQGPCSRTHSAIKRRIAFGTRIKNSPEGHEVRTRTQLATKRHTFANCQAKFRRVSLRLLRSPILIM